MNPFKMVKVFQRYVKVENFSESSHTVCRFSHITRPFPGRTRLGRKMFHNIGSFSPSSIFSLASCSSFSISSLSSLFAGMISTGGGGSSTLTSSEDIFRRYLKRATFVGSISAQNVSLNGPIWSNAFFGY